jgi:hypothetical protein
MVYAIMPGRWPIIIANGSTLALASLVMALKVIHQ